MSILAAFTNAVMLLGAMGALSWEAISRLPSPAATDGHVIMVVAGIGIVINTATALLFLRGQSQDLNIRGAFLHMAADAAVSAGVVIAGGMYLAFGWYWLDPIVSLVIAVIIVIGTWNLFRKFTHLLIDGVPDHVDPKAVREWLSQKPGVREVHDLHIWAISTTEVALTVHLVIPNGHPGDVFLREIEETLHHRFSIAHPTVQIETDTRTHHCILASADPRNFSVTELR